VLGSTGESVLLSREEADLLLAAVKEAAAPGRILIAGTGAESTAETIARTRRAAALGYQVALVKTPYYYKPAYRAEHFITHYRAVAEASPIPILLYSVPVFTNITLESPEIPGPGPASEHHWHQGQFRQHSAHRRSGSWSAPGLSGAHRRRCRDLSPHLLLAAAALFSRWPICFRKNAWIFLSCSSKGQYEQARQLQLQLVGASKLVVL